MTTPPNPAERQEVSLDQVREALIEKFGTEVLVTLLPKGNWVFDPWARLEGAQPHDQWVIGRKKDRGFFDVGVRDPKKAAWGQIEIREEPLAAQPRTDGRRIVSYIRIEVVAASGKVRVTASSVSKGQVFPGPLDREVGVLQTNAPRIDGDIAVLRRDVEVELGDGGVWKDIADHKAFGDLRVIGALCLAGLI